MHTANRYCNMSTIKKTLSELASIRFGIHLQPGKDGSVEYIQARQFDSKGNLKFLPDSKVILGPKLEDQLLRDGDILIIGKGNRNFAWCYRESLGPAIASSIFYVLSPDQRFIYPQYLAAYLNLPQSQLYFQQLAGGTSMPSLRKSELGVFSVPLLPLEQQKTVAELSNLHAQEIKLLENLISLKINHFKAIIAKITE